MKTLELKLKKDVLIVEIPRLADYEFINKECKYIKVGNEEIKLNASTLDKFEFLCKGSDLTEEIASELVDNFKLDFNKSFYVFKDYTMDWNKFSKSIPSFISAVESKDFHWLENPIPEPEIQGGYTEDGSFIGGYDDDWINEWQEAEAKTFKNPLIFVKK